LTRERDPPAGGEARVAVKPYPALFPIMNMTVNNSKRETPDGLGLAKLLSSCEGKGRGAPQVLEACASVRGRQIYNKIIH
jgi:hypothetical protein